jgi:hypothetical protein
LSASYRFSFPINISKVEKGSGKKHFFKAKKWAKLFSHNCLPVFEGGGLGIPEGGGSGDQGARGYPGHTGSFAPVLATIIAPGIHFSFLAQGAPEGRETGKDLMRNYAIMEPISWIHIFWYRYICYLVFSFIFSILCI